MWTDLIMGLVNAAPINLRRRLVRCTMICCAKGQEDLNRCWPQAALPPYHLHMSAIKSIMLCCTVGVWYAASFPPAAPYAHSRESIAKHSPACLARSF